eukprot:3213459-Karenia_brevis.AAC.1
MIIAATAPKAMHLGVDNLAVVRNANKMLHRLSSRHKLPAPIFSNMIDGDLWRLFWGIMVQKGPNSVRVSK